MRATFTRETVTPSTARLMIYCAAGTAAFRGLFTLLFALRGTAGLTLWNLLDAAILLAVAVGVFLRNLPAAWAGLIYCGLDAASKVLRYPNTSPLRKAGELGIYAMAIVCIGLYPRTRSTRADLGQHDQHSGSQDGQAV